jgi:hypothetical protein
MAILLAATSADAALQNRPLQAPLGAADTEVAAGTLAVQGVNGCWIVATGTVTTLPVGGTVDAVVNIFDDGNFIAGYPIELEGDGGTHSFCLVHQVTQPILQVAPGIGVYLQDEAGLAATTTFGSVTDFNDVTEVCTGPQPPCGGSALAVPAVDRAGLVALVLLLAGTAAWVLSRRRRAG